MSCGLGTEFALDVVYERNFGQEQSALTRGCGRYDYRNLQ